MDRDCKNVLSIEIFLPKKNYKYYFVAWTENSAIRNNYSRTDLFILRLTNKKKTHDIKFYYLVHIKYIESFSIFLAENNQQS